MRTRSLDFTPLDDFAPTYDAFYTSVSVGDDETLLLSAGHYYFEDLDFGNNSTLSLSITDGPISIYVKGADGTGMDVTTAFEMAKSKDFPTTDEVKSFIAFSTQTPREKARKKAQQRKENQIRRKVEWGIKHRAEIEAAKSPEQRLHEYAQAVMYGH